MSKNDFYAILMKAPFYFKGKKKTGSLCQLLGKAIHLFAEVNIMEMLDSHYPTYQVLGSADQKNVVKLPYVNISKTFAFAVAAFVLCLGDRTNYSLVSSSKFELINIFPTPVKNPRKKKKKILLCVYEEVHMLSLPLVVANYLSPLFTTKDQKKMDSVSSECLLNEAAQASIKVTRLKTLEEVQASATNVDTKVMKARSLLEHIGSMLPAINQENLAHSSNEDLLEDVLGVGEGDGEETERIYVETPPDSSFFSFYFSSPPGYGTIS
ncbi:hypothetical protein HAX54_034862 [Datura stramonium]|uniref:Uncharacterized protein n=1 Tax=Datura stramonium TaxID=4076 RepID=A0ABS8VEL7_DATST|nr:hypothetical protein [Datura stramonium]